MQNGYLVQNYSAVRCTLYAVRCTLYAVRCTLTFDFEKS